MLAALVLARVVTDQGGAGEEGAMPFPALLVAAYSVAAHARKRGLMRPGDAGL